MIYSRIVQSYLILVTRKSLKQLVAKVIKIKLNLHSTHRFILKETALKK